MNAPETLLSLGGHLEVWENIYGKIWVSYKKFEVKDGIFLIGTYGTGNTFEEACEDYLNKILWKNFVFNACTDYRKEFRVL